MYLGKSLSQLLARQPLERRLVAFGCAGDDLFGQCGRGGLLVPAGFFQPVAEGLLIHHDLPDSGQLLLNCPGATFEDDSQWWYNFLYRADKERGQDFTEDLFVPGYFKCRIDSPTKLVLWANLSRDYKPEIFILPDIEQVIRQLAAHRNEVIAPAKHDKTLEALYLADLPLTQAL